MPPPMSWTTNETMSRVTKIRASVEGEKSQTFLVGEKKFTMRAKICEDFVSMRCSTAERLGMRKNLTMYAYALTPVNTLVMSISTKRRSGSVLTDGRHQNKNLRHRRNARRLLVLRTQSAEHVCASFPECSHDYDPAEAIAVDECLGEMRNCEGAEEDGEDYGSGKAGRVLPEGIAGLGRDVAVGGGSCV